MRSVRLPKEIEKELEELSQKKNVSRSDIIREALTEYIASEKKQTRPFESGKKYFGKHSSGDTDRSVTYKSRIKELYREKHSD